MKRPLVDTLHHAYFLEGNREEAQKKIREFLVKELSVTLSGNPDVSFENHETFGINDARELKERASLRPLGERRYFIVSFNFITQEAQNALLKLFEDPPSNVHFFIVVPTGALFLPTLRSRLFFWNTANQKKESEEARKFLEESLDGRLKITERFSTKGGSTSGGKDIDNETKKSELLDFMNSLESVLYEKFQKRGEGGSTLKEILALKKYLFDRAPSTKMIAEYLALKLPKA